MIAQNREQEQNQIAELLHNIFDNSTDGILIIDQKGVIVFGNNRATVLMNQPLYQLSGKDFS